MSVQMRHQVLLLAVCLCALFYNLGLTHLWDEDEAHFGSVVVEMMARGDYVVPYFNGDLSTHKPALMYWVMIASTFLFGQTEFALRFGSVVFSIGSVLLTYHIGQALFSPRAGFWGAAALATCLQFVLVARAAVADPELLFFCTLPIAVLLRELMGGKDERLPWWRWALAYASMGVATLAKGPVGFVLPMAAIALFLLLKAPGRGNGEPVTESTRRVRGMVREFGRTFAASALLRTASAMRPLTAVLIILAVAAPWYIAVGMRTEGEWLRGFFLVQNLGRFSTSFESHDGGPLYYVLVVLVGTFPWCIFTFQSWRLMIVRLATGASSRSAYLLLASWIGVWFVAFTLAGTKLPHYVLPAYPALAILIGAFIDDWLSRAGRWGHSTLRGSWCLLVVLGLLIIGGMHFLGEELRSNERAIALIGFVPIVGGFLGLWASATRRRELALAGLASSALVFAVLLLGWGAVQVDLRQTSPQVAAWLRDLSPGHRPILAEYGGFQESLVYYTRSRVQRLNTPEQVAEYFEQNPAGFLLTTDDNLVRIGRLPAQIVSLRTIPRFPKHGVLILLGPAAVANAEKIALP